MLKVKVRRFGKSLGIVLPKEALTRLRTREGDDLLLIEGPEVGYQLASCDPAFVQKLQKVEEILGRYRNALRALASAK